MKKILISLLLLTCFLFFAFTFIPGSAVFTASEGNVNFISKAPLETIEAASHKLNGTLDIGKKTFTFSIPINSFDGFNSALQKQYFNENYMESDKLPQATFAGKIVENTDMSMPGTYIVRTKGIMMIHGIEKEMIIKSKIIVKNKRVTVESSFNILLEDFNIKIPALRNKKLAEEINVDIKVDMAPKK
jgi:polyisoprenoid-binding protein YceI